MDASYALDPVFTLNCPPFSAPVESDLLRLQHKLSKLPPAARPAGPSPQVVQSAGMLSFSQEATRLRGGCTRERMQDVQPRFMSELMPLPATANHVLQPFPREGMASRIAAKDAYAALCSK